MTGELVPAVLLPRFSSFVGPGSFVTVPLDVTQYEVFDGFFGRGPLVGGAASNPFLVYFEESHDANAWTQCITAPAQPMDATDLPAAISVTIHRRWLRVRVELLADANGVVAVTLWLAGGLQRRVLEA